MKWQDKLTKKELSHLRKEAGCRTLAATKKTFDTQAKMRKKSEAEGLPVGMAEPCWDCLTIARKLGLR